MNENNKRLLNEQLFFKFQNHNWWMFESGLFYNTVNIKRYVETKTDNLEVFYLKVIFKYVKLR